ncbi:MAG: GMC family oxidoreductase [Acetobacteraceae bacterium]
MHDVLILGRGSAGCVLAARLSEMPGLSVLLVEAGKDLTVATAPADVLSNYPGKAYFNPEFTWPGLNAVLGAAAGNADSGRVTARYEQARILGGGSSINGLCANRGAPADYDEWQALGAAGWSWETVLPYFRKLERDLDFSGEYHGNDGPVAIRRFPEQDWSPFVRSVAAAVQARGYPMLADQNGRWEDGIMRVAVSVDEAGQRVSCALAYLTEAVRARPNLRVITEAHVRRIVFDGRVAVGAEIQVAGKTELVHARQTILSCGTIHSPALLMRSGVGPVAALRALEIPVVAARAGVGQNLVEHPVVSISCYLGRSGRLANLQRHHTQAHFRFSSGVADCPPGDMILAVIARSGWHALGQRVGSLYFWVNKAYSTGQVGLRSADPAAEPLVDFRMLSDWRDQERLRSAFRLMAEIAADPALDGVRSTIFPTNYSDRVRKVSRPGLRNSLQMLLLGMILDASTPALRSWLVNTLITGGSRIDVLLRDDAALDEFLKKVVTGVWHPVGSCRMGPADDPMAVVGPSGRAYGVEGLRVVDASVMPSIPCGNTNIPTIMLAERMADLIKAEFTKDAAPTADALSA